MLELRVHTWWSSWHRVSKCSRQVGEQQRLLLFIQLSERLPNAHFINVALCRLQTIVKVYMREHSVCYITNDDLQRSLTMIRL